LFKPPRLRSMELSHAERKTTWTELFFDLAYVAAIAQLAHGLKEAPTGHGVIAFVILFVPVWWSWVGITFYADRFDSDDVLDRLLLALQMLLVAVLAVQMHDGVGANAPSFALAYIALRVLLIFQYVRAHMHIQAARSLTGWYIRGFSLAVLPWLVSIFVPPLIRLILWAVGILIEMVTPLTARSRQAALPLSTTHLPERFGLFTIMVLGESLVSAVRGMTEQHRVPTSVLAAVLSFVFAFGIWWLYFDNVSHSIVRRTRFAGQVWVFVHLLLAMGLTASGVGAELVISCPPSGAVAGATRWIFCVAAASCFASLAIILLATARSATERLRRDPQPRLLLAAAGVMLLIPLLGARVPVFLLIGSACALTVLLLVLGKSQPQASAWQDEA
jgi:low temperature requirement protein LtrA